MINLNEPATWSEQNAYKLQYEQTYYEQSSIFMYIYFTAHSDG